jgi:hypothetical protein
MPNYKFKRVTLFAGHYGSGKTNLAVNFALKMKEQGEQVKIADLDIVNPYFRTKDSAEKLSKAGIELISPTFANTNVDLPALPQEVYKLFSQKEFKAILDIGGDDRGAYALGRYAPSILEENDYEMIFVANFFRPLTRTAEEALEVMREIEDACKIKFTAIINNSNLGKDTTAWAVENTEKIAEQLSVISGLPVIFTTATEEVAKDLTANNLMQITLQEKYFDIKEN